MVNEMVFSLTKFYVCNHTSGCKIFSQIHFQPKQTQPK